MTRSPTLSRKRTEARPDLVDGPVLLGGHQGKPVIAAAMAWTSFQALCQQLALGLQPAVTGLVLDELVDLTGYVRQRDTLCRG